MDGRSVVERLKTTGCGLCYGGGGSTERGGHDFVYLFITWDVL